MGIKNFENEAVDVSIDEMKFFKNINEKDLLKEVEKVFGKIKLEREHDNEITIFYFKGEHIAQITKNESWVASWEEIEALVGVI